MQCDLSWALGGIRLRQLLLEWVLDTDGERVRHGSNLGQYPHRATRDQKVGARSPAAYVNAVIDALAHLGVRNLEMPVTSGRVWEALEKKD